MSSSLLDLWKVRAFRVGAGAAAIGATTVAGIIRNKWFALHLDTEGIGVIGQVVAAHTWIGVLAALGLGVPLARAIGSARAKDDAAGVRRAVWTAFSIAGLSTAVLVAAALVLAPQLSMVILGDGGYTLLIRISMLGTAGYAVQLLAQGVFAGHSDVRPPFTLALAGGTATVVAALLLVPGAGITGGVLSAALYFPAGLFVVALWHRRAYAQAILPAPDRRMDGATARMLLTIGGSALVLALADQGSLLGLRALFLREHGLSANGLFQAALAIAQQVGAIFYAYLANYAFGRISGAEGVEAVRAYTQRQWLPLMAAATAAFALAMLAASPLLHLFYSDRFDAARPMMAWMLFGEFCRVAVQAWALGALPLNRTGRWFACGIVYPVVFAIAYPFCADFAGPVGLALAYATGAFVSLLVCGTLMWRAGVTLRARDLAVVATAVAALAALAASVSGWPPAA